MAGEWEGDDSVDEGGEEADVLEARDVVAVGILSG